MNQRLRSNSYNCPALDVRLMAMSPQAFTLTGFERVAGVEFAQSWLIAECSRRH
jgi:hypothetical protein